MKIALTGSEGLFGNGFSRIAAADHKLLELPHKVLELTDRAEVMRILGRTDIDLLVHPAGIPDIDYCELHPEQAWKVNVEATRNLVEAANNFRFGIVFISTDAVFDGKKSSPYFEDDLTNPPTVYGKTKLAAEKLVLTAAKHWIFRVSVLFGPGKKNFVDRVIDDARAGKEAVAALDQIGSATYTLDAARTILQAVKLSPGGVFHLSNTGVCSRFQLAQEAVRLAGLDREKVKGVPLAEMRRPAVRLQYSVMAMRALEEAGVPRTRTWQSALAEYIAVNRT